MTDKIASPSKNAAFAQGRPPRQQLQAFAAALTIFGISVAGTFVLLGGDWHSDRGRVALTIYSAIPGFVGVLIKALMAPRHSNPSAPAVLGLRVAFGWMLGAWLLASTLVLVMTIQLDPISHQPFVRGLAVGPTLMALFALGQELGFRGFLLGTLQEKGTPPRKAIAITTASWLLWTLPVTISMASGFGEGLWLVAWTSITGWFLAELRLHSRSILPTATFWGTYTALVAALPTYASAGAKPALCMLGLAVVFSFGARRFRTWYLARTTP